MSTRGKDSFFSEKNVDGLPLQKFDAEPAPLYLSVLHKRGRPDDRGIAPPPVPVMVPRPP